MGSAGRGRGQRGVHVVELGQVGERHERGWGQVDLAAMAAVEHLAWREPRVVVDLTAVDEHVAVAGPGDEEPRGVAPRRHGRRRPVREGNELVRLDQEGALLGRLTGRGPAGGGFVVEVVRLGDRPRRPSRRGTPTCRRRRPSTCGAASASRARPSASRTRTTVAAGMAGGSSGSVIARMLPCRSALRASTGPVDPPASPGRSISGSGSGSTPCSARSASTSSGWSPHERGSPSITSNIVTPSGPATNGTERRSLRAARCACPPGTPGRRT